MLLKWKSVVVSSNWTLFPDMPLLVSGLRMEVRTRSARWPFTWAKGTRSVLMCVWERVFCNSTRPAHRECINARTPLAMSLSFSFLTVTKHRAPRHPPPPPHSPDPLQFYPVLWDTPDTPKMHNGRGEGEINGFINNVNTAIELKVL